MLIEISHLKLSLHGRTILNGVDLCMQPGDIYGLLGPNGAGKSTTLSVVTGLRPAAAGKVSVLGHDPWSERTEVHRKIGVLPEQGGFYEWMSAKDYLSWFSGLYGDKLIDADARRYLAQVGLDDANNRPIGTYSRGMKQRLGLARALLNDPTLLILDEPTNGLDPRGRREIHDVLLELSQRHGVGILLCTHLLDDVDRLCNRIGIIHLGKTVAEGRLAELLLNGQAPLRYRLRVSEAPGNGALLAGEGLIRVAAKKGDWWHVNLCAGHQPDAVWRTLIGSGWRIAEIHSESGDLEEFYLNLTATEKAA